MDCFASLAMTNYSFEIPGLVLKHQPGMTTSIA